ncbi:uncharacterized protein LOC122818873 [Drosophila biarmipes]|uniref:uncharacterized protein LOC122818873 n=1 Tax=Drosophila biarmipes TaxID=125945 RepID=UPI001CDA8BF7|nr:uncharacterized protein LOC122818873 [Drosophila biarmipes]
MRKVLIIFLLGVALQRTAVVSAQDSPCSEEFKRITGVLESRLQSFGEALNQRLESFENRLTKSECFTKFTIPNERIPTFDYGSRVRSIFNDFIEIYEATMRERESVLTYTDNEQISKSIENRINETMQDIQKLGELDSSADRQTNKTTVVFDFENAEFNIPMLKEAYDNMTKEGKTSSVSPSASQDKKMDQIVKYLIEQYDKMAKDGEKADREVTTTEGSTETESTTDSSYGSLDINATTLLELYKAWSEKKDIKHVKKGLKQLISNTASPPPESTTDSNDELFLQALLTSNSNVTAMIEQYNLWSSKYGMEQTHIKEELKENSGETTTENTSTDSSTDDDDDWGV